MTGAHVAVQRLGASLAAQVIEGQGLLWKSTGDAYLDAHYESELRKSAALARMLCPEAREAIDSGWPT